MWTNKFRLTYCSILTSISILYSQEVKIDNLSFDKSGQIKWTTINEKANAKFDVEEWRWAKWVIIGQINGTGNGNYSCSFLADTTCRIYQVRITSGQYHSASINYPNPIKIDISGSCSKQVIRFHHMTKFEVWDKYENKILSGCDSILIFSDFKKGNYHLNVGDKLTQFFKN